MPDKWDVIVVGAGMGGLTAAARLAQAGRKILVLDANTHPGGTAYVYRRKGFTFPMGPLGFSSPARVADMLKSIGIAQEIALKRVNYRLNAFGLDLPLSLPYKSMIEEYSRAFPAEAGGIKRFFNDMLKIAAALKNPDERTGETEKIFGLSAGDYLDLLIKDKTLRRILGSMGTHEPYSGTPLLAAMWNLLCQEGIYYPDGGMFRLCDMLSQAVEIKCEIRLKTEVEEIRVENGKAAGVILANGEKLDAGSVVSNADFKTTFIKLMKKDAVPVPWREAIMSAKQTMSNLQVCIGLEKSKANLDAFKNASRLIYRRGGAGDGSTRPDWSASEIDPSALVLGEMEISLWSADDPSLAPEGRAVIVIRVEADHGHFEKHRPSRRKRSPGYMEYKTRLGKALVGEASRIIGGLADAVVFMDVATPLTFEEMGGRSGGAVAGWSWDYEDDRDFLSRELILTPVRGLYMAGYQAFSSLFTGGVPTAMESGLKAAQALIDGRNPAEEINIPRPKKLVKK